MAGVTSKEIAAHLGISPSAVSFALNGKPGVSDETRKLVIATAEKMGYNSAKLANAISKRQRICFVFYVNQLVSIAENTTFSTFVLQGAETAASSRGYSIMVKYVHAGESIAKQLENTVNEADGFIILGTDLNNGSKAEMKEFSDSIGGKPVVIIDSPLDFGFADCVINDNYGGAKNAVKYLLSRGFRKIGYIRSKHRIVNFEQRETGLNAALKEAGLECHSVVDTEVSLDEAFKSIDGYLNTGTELPEAFFAENDIIAAAAMRAFNAHHISVPNQISIIGFDDIPICELTAPALSTVHSFKEQLGETAVDLLFLKFSKVSSESADATRGCRIVSISTGLHIRDSVK